MMNIDLPMCIGFSNGLVNASNVNYKPVSTEIRGTDLFVKVKIVIKGEDFSCYYECPLDEDEELRKITFDAVLFTTYKIDLCKFRLYKEIPCECVEEVKPEVLFVSEDGKDLQDLDIKSIVKDSLETRLADNINCIIDIGDEY